jgi:hypothetical protein
LICLQRRWQDTFILSEKDNATPVITLAGLIDMKKELGREKDHKDIELIRGYLRHNKSNIKA